MSKCWTVLPLVFSLFLVAAYANPVPSLAGSMPHTLDLNTAVPLVVPAAVLVPDECDDGCDGESDTTQTSGSDQCGSSINFTSVATDGICSGDHPYCSVESQCQWEFGYTWSTGCPGTVTISGWGLFTVSHTVHVTDPNGGSGSGGGPTTYKLNGAGEGGVGGAQSVNITIVNATGSISRQTKALCKYCPSGT